MESGAKWLRFLWPLSQPISVIQSDQTVCPAIGAKADTQLSLMINTI